MHRKSRNLKGTAILYNDIDRSKNHVQTGIKVYIRFWTGLYQHANLYRGIVKVMWRVFNQLNVCFYSDMQ